MTDRIDDFGTVNAAIAAAAAPASSGFAVVGLGAGTGGLAALCGFFANVPAAAGIAYLVLYQPMAGDVDDAVDALRRATRMPVLTVERRTALAADRVYVVPPTRALSFDGDTVVPDAARIVERRFAIDFFFRALAETFQQRLAVIVLSGAGSAGAVGIGRVREHGGLTFVQSSDDAERDGMPRAAIGTGVVDFVLPVAGIARALVDLVVSARAIRLPAEVGVLTSKPRHDHSLRAADALTDLLALVRKRTGHDFGHYRSATLIRRIERRLQVNALQSLPDYRDYLASHPNETASLLQDLLGSVTNFFRDGAAFDALKEAALRPLSSRRNEKHSIRVWVAGCATGEEAYSLAMLLGDEVERHRRAVDFQIFATDVDEVALATARAGRYPLSIVADVDVGRLRRYFVRDRECYRVGAWLRERVLFARHDVLVDPPFANVDLVCCRNLLIDLDRDAQRQVIDGFRFTLGRSGYLFLGSGESTEAVATAFRTVDDAARIFVVDPQPASQHADAVPALAPWSADDVRDSLQASSDDRRDATQPAGAGVDEPHSPGAEPDAGRRELRSARAQPDAASRELQKRASASEADELPPPYDPSEIATIVVDDALRVIRFTPGAGQLCNLIASDAGRPLLHIRNGLRYDALAADAAEAFGSRQRIEREIDAEDGRRFLARIQPYRNPQGLGNGATISFVDITLLDRVRRRLQDGEAHLRLAAETTRDFAILTMDYDGRVTAWNHGAERIFGWTQDEMLGRHADILFTPEDRAVGVPEREISNARALGRAEDDRWHVRKDGSRFYCSGVVTPYGGAGDADPRGLAKIARDITGLRREQTTRDAMLAEERAARTQYEKSSRLKDQFLAVMSHELKHPLNLIHVNAELLSRIPEVRGHPSAARAAQTIRKTVVGQGKIIDDLLDLSRTRTGKLTLEIEAVDLAATLGTIVEAARSDATEKGLVLALQSDTDVEPVAGDPVRIHQIAWNLLSNALKFTPAGGRIDIRLQRDGTQARVTVADTGRGIDARFLPHVFDMFGQDQSRGGPSGGGMGIGLALVRELAVAQGGRVEAQSDGPGRGARFAVWLPLFRERVQELPADDPETGRSLSGMRILVVEDARDALDPFVELLELEGAIATGVLDGRSAIERLSEQDFDLLISDIAMPDLGGYELIAQIRSLPRAANITAVALTGYGRGRDKQQALDSGFDAHIAKPASLDDLRRLLAGVRRAPPP